MQLAPDEIKYFVKSSWPEECGVSGNVCVCVCVFGD